MQLFFGFFWRGLLLGLAGGIVAGWLFAWCVLLAVVLIQRPDEPFISALGFTLPAGGLAGLILGFGLGALKTQEGRRRYAIIGALIGVGLAGFPIFLLSLLALPIAAFVGSIVGRLIGLPAALLLAAITLWRHSPPTSRTIYITTMRLIAMLVSFIATTPILLWLVHLYGGFQSSGEPAWRDFAIITVVIGVVSAAAAWVLVPFGVNWYVDAALPRRDFEPRLGSTSADETVRLS